jgi:hypothetical protein
MPAQFIEQAKETTARILRRIERARLYYTAYSSHIEGIACMSEPTQLGPWLRIGDIAPTSQLTELSDAGVRTIDLRTLWQDTPLVIMFLRHFG